MVTQDVRLTRDLCESEAGDGTQRNGGSSWSRFMCPLSHMLELSHIAHINPLTYVVDGVRALMLSGGSSESGLGTDIVVLLAITLILAVICARLYPRIVQ